MAARHRARASSIQILKIETVESNKVRRPQVKQMIVSYIIISQYLFLLVELKLFNDFACFVIG